MRRNLDKEHLLKLTLAVYRVTAIFPVGQELGPKIRESADKILANLLCSENGSRCIGEILGLFDVAEKKNWVDKRNFLVLKREYDKVGHAMSNLCEETVENPLAASRQEKILAVMNSNGMVKIGDLIKVFPGVNRRTVLRDLDKLCQAGAVVRNGNGRGAHYLGNGHKHDMSQ